MTLLVVAAEATSDTTTIIDYLERNAGAAVASEYGQRFVQTTERIVDMPLSGSPRPALGDRVRIGVVAPYVLVYEYDAVRDEVTLLRVLHGRRNVSRLLTRR
jgi:plasmid stabilization system protein ParE